MTKIEREVVAELIEQVKTVTYWLKDTAYPARSTVALNEALINAQTILNHRVPRVTEQEGKQ